MKVAIVGSRGITDYHEVENAIRGSPWAGDSSPYNWDVEFISGGADGVDTLGEEFAENYDLSIDVRDPNWGDWSHGHPALTRNTEIVEEADAVIAVWDGKSRGTRDTIDKALDRAVPLYVKVVE